jgi:hypothetical protein
MERIKTITYKGKEIFYTDLSDFDRETKQELKDTLEASKAYVAKQPLNSVLILTNYKNLRYDSEVVGFFKDYAEHNKPFVKASALVGMESIQKLAFTFIQRFSERELKLFDDEQAALDWLIEH